MKAADECTLKSKAQHALRLKAMLARTILVEPTISMSTGVLSVEGLRRLFLIGANSSFAAHAGPPTVISRLTPTRANR